MKPVISIDRLSKQYRIGPRLHQSYRTAREALARVLTHPWRGLRTLLSSQGAKTAPETIWALRDVSFDVAAGEVVGIIGRNGAGKSTLLKILSRITEPTSGHAALHGRVGNLLEVGTGFHPELTGRENIYLSGAILGMTRREIARKFDEIVAFAEIETFLDTPVKRYSSGMYVRLAFAVAAHLEPEILIVDEVLAVGDLEFQKKCLGKMGQVARSGRTILFVSHNMAAVQKLCSTAALLSGGRLERAGPCADVLAAYLRSALGKEEDRLPLSHYRVPGFTPVIRAVEILGPEGEPASHFSAGSSMTFQIHYDSPVPLKEPLFGVFVRGQTGEPLFHLQSLAQHTPLRSLPQRGTVRCHVPCLPLAPGLYWLSFNCSLLHDPRCLDFLEQPLSIAVEQADFFGTGLLPPRPNGPFLVRAQWQFGPSAAGMTELPDPVGVVPGPELLG
jgi:lipopolysaccharide transport system ATP-binding protein